MTKTDTTMTVYLVLTVMPFGTVVALFVSLASLAPGTGLWWLTVFVSTLLCALTVFFAYRTWTLVRSDHSDRKVEDQ